MTDPKKYTLSVAVTIVIANMIGTGVFTSLGFQVGSLPSGFSILVLWLVGGLVSLAGAFTYAEMATTLKKSGGEYFYLGRIIHPVAGFVAGWMSLLVGFAGAVSAVALAMGKYSTVILGVSPKIIAIAAILGVTAVHWFGVKTGGRVQTLLTSIKLLLIVFFCVAPFFANESTLSHISFLPQPGDWKLILSPGFAVSLIFVMYAYTGWNAAAYIAGNLERASKNLPIALITGTIIVIVIYLSLNAMFLFSATFDELNGKIEIGNVVAEKLFGSKTGAFFSAIFGIALLSTLSAMTIAGPRVTEAMGVDYPIFESFARKNKYDMPWQALLIQAAWAISLVLISSFEKIIQYIQISLSIFSMMVVLSIFKLRKMYPHSERPYSMPLYPLPPILFTICTCWMIYYVTKRDPYIILYSVGTMIPGIILYFVAAKKKTT
jgi:APA family basic amino acid/polyamine antiporter